MTMQNFWDVEARTGKWASYYDGASTAQTYNFFTRRTTVVKLLEPDGDYPRVLDVGCGTGDYVEVAKRHNGAFFGIDFAPHMIQQAVERVGEHGERNLFVVGTGDKLPFADRSFDLVLALGYIEYFHDAGPAIVEIRRVLKPGGALVMQSFKWELFGNMGRKVAGPLLHRLRKNGKAAPMANPLPPDWIDKKYSKRELDALLARFGFRLDRGVYNNFHTMPRRMRYRFPKLYIRASEAIGKVAPKLFGFLAVNYIAKYVLENPDAKG